MERETAKNAAALAQVDLQSLCELVVASAFPVAAKQEPLTQVQAQQNSNNDDEDANLGVPAAAIYRSHSGGILDVLEDMKEKVEEQLVSLRKTEMNAKHNFAMLKQSLEDQFKFDDKDEDFWILPILGSDFGTPVALSATKTIPVFQYLFVALCATY